MKNTTIKIKIFLVLIIIIILFALIILLNSFTTVPTGFVGIRTRFGKASQYIVQEGLNLQIPMIEKIVLMDCRTQKAEINCSTASKDLQEVTLQVAVNYNVTVDNAYNIYKNIGVNYESIMISPSILESVKGVTAQYTAEELITKRAEVSDKMEENVKFIKSL